MFSVLTQDPSSTTAATLAQARRQIREIFESRKTESAVASKDDEGEPSGAGAPSAGPNSMLIFSEEDVKDPPAPTKPAPAPAADALAGFGRSLSRTGKNVPAAFRVARSKSNSAESSQEVKEIEENSQDIKVKPVEIKIEPAEIKEDNSQETKVEPVAIKVEIPSESFMDCSEDFPTVMCEVVREEEEQRAKEQRENQEADLDLRRRELDLERVKSDTPPARFPSDFILMGPVGGFVLASSILGSRAQQPAGAPLVSSLSPPASPIPLMTRTNSARVSLVPLTLVADALGANQAEAQTTAALRQAEAQTTAALRQASAPLVTPDESQTTPPKPDAPSKPKSSKRRRPESPPAERPQRPSDSPTDPPAPAGAAAGRRRRLLTPVSRAEADDFRRRLPRAASPSPEPASARAASVARSVSLAPSAARSVSAARCGSRGGSAAPSSASASAQNPAMRSAHATAVARMLSVTSIYADRLAAPTGRVLYGSADHGPTPLARTMSGPTPLARTLSGPLLVARVLADPDRVSMPRPLVSSALMALTLGRGDSGSASPVYGEEYDPLSPSFNHLYNPEPPSREGSSHPPSGRSMQGSSGSSGSVGPTDPSETPERDDGLPSDTSGTSPTVTARSSQGPAPAGGVADSQSEAGNAESQPEPGNAAESQSETGNAAESQPEAGNAAESQPEPGNTESQSEAGNAAHSRAPTRSISPNDEDDDSDVVLIQEEEDFCDRLMGSASESGEIRTELVQMALGWRPVDPADMQWDDRSAAALLDAVSASTRLLDRSLANICSVATEVRGRFQVVLGEAPTESHADHRSIMGVVATDALQDAVRDVALTAHLASTVMSELCKAEAGQHREVLRRAASLRAAALEASEPTPAPPTESPPPLPAASAEAPAAVPAPPPPAACEDKASTFVQSLDASVDAMNTSAQAAAKTVELANMRLKRLRAALVEAGSLEEGRIRYTREAVTVIRLATASAKEAVESASNVVKMSDSAADCIEESINTCVERAKLGGAGAAAGGAGAAAGGDGAAGGGAGAAGGGAKSADSPKSPSGDFSPKISAGSILRYQPGRDFSPEFAVPLPEAPKEEVPDTPPEELERMELAARA